MVINMNDSPVIVEAKPRMLNSVFFPSSIVLLSIPNCVRSRGLCPEIGHRSGPSWNRIYRVLRRLALLSFLICFASSRSFCSCTFMSCGAIFCAPRRPNCCTAGGAEGLLPSRVSLRNLCWRGPSAGPRFITGAFARSTSHAPPCSVSDVRSICLPGVCLLRVSHSPASMLVHSGVRCLSRCLRVNCSEAICRFPFSQSSHDSVPQVEFAGLSS